MAEKEIPKLIIKQYYYIDEDGNYVNTGTGNPVHQAQIEKQLAEDVEVSKVTSQPVKINRNQKEFLILLKPLLIGEQLGI